MLDLLIMLSRYVFVAYIGVFLWLAVVYIAYEQGGNFGNPYNAVVLQRRIIFAFHITAFSILTFQTTLFDWETCVFGILCLAFLLLLFFALDKFYYDGCPLIWTGVVFLIDISLVILQRIQPSLAHRQLIWFLIGIIGVMLLPIFLRWFPRFEVFEGACIIISYGLLICTQFFGVESGGSTNWLRFSLLGQSISFQPSEIVKFLFVFYLASVFRKRVGLKSLLISGSLSAGIVLLLVLQKDLGSALIFFMTFMVLLYIATSNEFLFLLGMVAASGASFVAYKIFNHVRVRVAIWSNPWTDIEGSGYQIVNSLFAITTWGMWGSGLTKGVPTVIPVVESDLLFAAICEEFGAIFGAGVIAIFIMLLYRGVRIALDCNRRYYSILAMGVTTMLVFQAFIIIGGVIKLIPLTGVTLPLVSYGGSSVLVSCMMVGLLQWVCVYCEQHERQESRTNEATEQWDFQQPSTFTVPIEQEAAEEIVSEDAYHSKKEGRKRRESNEE
ncbi:MAG: FtsW/RodA/SpoVE family cell cycle protein [Bacillota bacterium]